MKQFLRHYFCVRQRMESWKWQWKLQTTERQLASIADADRCCTGSMDRLNVNVVSASDHGSCRRRMQCMCRSHRICSSRPPSFPRCRPNTRFSRSTLLSTTRQIHHADRWQPLAYANPNPNPNKYGVPTGDSHLNDAFTSMRLSVQVPVSSGPIGRIPPRLTAGWWNF